MPFLQTLTSIFSTSGNPNSAAASRHKTRPSAVQAGADAFSLPTTRYPGVNGMDSASSSPGPSRRTSTSNYTAYPPAKEAYQPAALTYYPPLSHTYHRLRVALSDSFPELLDTLNYPVDAVLLAQFEAEIGCALPPAVRDSFAVADGQDLEASINLGSTGSFFGLVFLSLEEVMREWSFWRAAEHDPSSGQNAAVLATMASVPPGWIQGKYACRGWVPLMSDRTGNYVGIDLEPGKGGSRGQVIVFGRDFDRKCVLWKGEGEGGWGRWLAGLVDELEAGEGAGWEAEKSGSGSGASSDEEDEVGYTDYNGGAAYGEASRALKLTGRYKGWNTLEAWWDKSVNRWEEMGLGMDVAEVERGLAEARRLTGADQEDEYGEGGVQGIGKGKGREVERLDVGMGMSTAAAQVEVPVIGSNIPLPQPPSTPTPHDSDALLSPASPDIPTVPRLSTTASSPRRVITPLPSSSDHPLSSHTDSRGFLSPPVTGSSGSTSQSGGSLSHRRRSTRPVPAPSPLDLPTRADVQAMSAIAMAQDSGLRGGWVMNIDSTGNARRGAARAANANAAGTVAGGYGYGYGSGSGGDIGRPSGDGMVDIDLDLEGGRGDRVGGPSQERWRAEMERQREEEKLALAGVEHRRPSPNLLPRNSWSSAGTGTRSPSPLGMAIPLSGSRSGSPSPYDSPYLTGPGPGAESLGFGTDATPRAGMRERDDPLLAHPHPSPAIAGLRPPPLASQSSGPSWEKSEDGDREVIRASAAAIAGRGRPSDSFYGVPRVNRESSTTSLSSETGLLGGEGSLPTPTTAAGRRPAELSIDVTPNSASGKGARETAGTPPVIHSSPVQSPSKFGHVSGAAVGTAGKEGDLEGMMQDISLDDGAGPGAGSATGEMVGSPTTPTAPKRPVVV